MAPPAESLSYEDLSTVCRSEQKSKNITEVRRDFYPAIRACRERLKSEYERETSVNPFSIKTKLANKALTEFQDMVQLTFELRMKKILAMALRAAEGGKIDQARLTVEEKEIFDAVFNLMGERHASLLEGRTAKPSEAEEPSISTKVPEMVVEAVREQEVFDPSGLAADVLVSPVTNAAPPASLSEVAPEVKPSTASSIPPSPLPVTKAPLPDTKAPDVPPAVVPAQASSPSTVVKATAPAADQVILRILEDLPPIAGADRNYKLKKEDLVTLPPAIAKALVARKKAVIVQPGDNSG
jgi:DNA replication factor GINS